MAASLSQPSWSWATWRTARSALLRRSGGYLFTAHSKPSSNRRCCSGVNGDGAAASVPRAIIGRARLVRRGGGVKARHRAVTAPSLATGGDCQGRAYLAHPRGSETAEPSDQPGPVNALDVIEADR